MPQEMAWGAQIIWYVSSHGDGGRLRRKMAAVGRGNETKEFHELVDVLSLSLRREHT
jgi:threonine aldolase